MNRKMVNHVGDAERDQAWRSSLLALGGQARMSLPSASVRARETRSVP
jgi:hypothetical protein